MKLKDDSYNQAWSLTADLLIVFFFFGSIKKKKKRIFRFVKIEPKLIKCETFYASLWTCCSTVHLKYEPLLSYPHMLHEGETLFVWETAALTFPGGFADGGKTGEGFEIVLGRLLFKCKIRL